ncbi:MAG: hypothetical protein AAF772_04745, partial [Acidobacteriota bacterium]
GAPAGGALPEAETAIRERFPQVRISSAAACARGWHHRGRLRSAQNPSKLSIAQFSSERPIVRGADRDGRQRRLAFVQVEFNLNSSGTLLVTLLKCA